jgi:hypothetical protein
VIYYYGSCRILSYNSLHPYPRIIKISVMLGTSGLNNKGGISMEESKRVFETADKYENEAYYEDLLFRYNPDNTLIKDIEASSNEQFIGEVLEMISRITCEPVTTIEDEYKEEIDLYYSGKGQYLVQCKGYKSLSGVVISIEKI